jgi:hypothetical protein
MSDQQVSRRSILAGAAALLATPAAAKSKLKVSIFSKHLQFVQGTELAKAASEIGFDGVDITVRKGGHIAPEQVKETLPPLVATLRKQGLEVPMITTEIVDADTPHAEDVIRTASDTPAPPVVLPEDGDLSVDEQVGDAVTTEQSYVRYAQNEVAATESDARTALAKIIPPVPAARP